MSVLVRIAGLILLAWLAWAVLMYAAQRAMVFPGNQRHAAPVVLPAFATRVAIGRSPDAGHAIFLRTDRTVPAPAVLFAHGNAEFAAQNVAEFAPWVAEGYHVLLVEYPGYDGAPGQPNQASIDALWLAAHDWLADRPDVDPRRIIGIGRSLGSGPTAALAARRPLAAVVLHSGFASTAKFAHARALPGFLVRDRWDNVGALRTFGGPVFATHGRRDTIIPPSHAEAVARLPNVQVHWMDCGHNDCPMSDAEQHRVFAFLATVGAAPDRVL